MENVVLLSPADAAKVLGVSRSCLAKWRMRRRGIPFVRVGASVRYRVEDVQRFVGQNVVEVASDDRKDGGR
jgi:excisionase family DNA binding protein